MATKTRAKETQVETNTPEQPAVAAETPVSQKTASQEEAKPEPVVPEPVVPEPVVPEPAMAEPAVPELESVSLLAERHRVPGWQLAALLRFTGWNDDKMIRDEAFRQALVELKSRRTGGGRR